MKAATANLVTDHFKGLYARKRGSGKVEANLETIAAAGDLGGETKWILPFCAAKSMLD